MTNKRSIIFKLAVYSFLYAVTIGIVLSVVLLAPESKNQFPILRSVIILFSSILLAKYFVYMMIAPWHDVRLKVRELKGEVIESNPLVSIIIPAWNEEVGLLTTVKTILTSTYRNIEIIIVNDGSTDGSDKIMRDFIAEYEQLIAQSHTKKIAIRYYYKENGGKGRALNYGVERSNGEIIMSIDADCILTPTTVANFVIPFKDPTVYAAVGNVKIGNTKTLICTLQYLEFLFSFYFKKAESLLNTIYIIGGAAGAFRREVFQELGGYDHSNITEDIELSVRIQKAGMRIVYASEAIVYTEGASNFAGLMKQRLRWKRGRFQTFRQHSDFFFSSDRKHNKLLTFIMLPLGIFGDTQLFLELYFLAFLYAYSLWSHDFSSFISGIVIVSIMFFVQMFFEKSATKSVSFYLLAPIGWLLFYASTWVEYNALIKSIWGDITKKKIVWQKWERKGCLEDEARTV